MFTNYNDLRRSIVFVIASIALVAGSIYLAFITIQVNTWIIIGMALAILYIAITLFIDIYRRLDS